jgi:predicted transcriptional regulator
MDSLAVERVALMSIKPQYAEAIFAGSKGVEFRKRRLARDISQVVVYATLPVGRILGAFSVLTCDVASPSALWQRHHHHAGIQRAAYREYFRGREIAIGIVIERAIALDAPLPLAEVWPSARPPQSFQYLPQVSPLMATLGELEPSRG